MWFNSVADAPTALASGAYMKSQIGSRRNLRRRRRPRIAGRRHLDLLMRREHDCREHPPYGLRQAGGGVLRDDAKARVAAIPERRAADRRGRRSDGPRRPQARRRPPRSRTTGGRCRSCGLPTPARWIARECSACGGICPATSAVDDRLKPVDDDPGEYAGQQAKGRADDHRRDRPAIGFDAPRAAAAVRARPR